MSSIKENYQIMFTTYTYLLTIAQLKEMLGIGITLAYRLVRNNTIIALKIGREHKIPKANVISYLINANKVTDQIFNNLNGIIFLISVSRLNLVCYNFKGS